MLADLSEHLEDKNAELQMKYILLEQKYLEALNSGNTIEAVKVLHYLTS